MEKCSIADSDGGVVVIEYLFFFNIDITGHKWVLTVTMCTLKEQGDLSCDKSPCCKNIVDTSL